MATQIQSQASNEIKVNTENRPHYDPQKHLNISIKRAILSANWNDFINELRRLYGNEAVKVAWRYSTPVI